MSPTLPADSSAVVPEPMYQEAFLICNLHTKAGGTALNQFYQELGDTFHHPLLCRPCLTPCRPTTRCPSPRLFPGVLFGTGSASASGTGTGRASWCRRKTSVWFSSLSAWELQFAKSRPRWVQMQYESLYKRLDVTTYVVKMYDARVNILCDIVLSCGFTKVPERTWPARRPRGKSTGTTT